MPTVHYVWSGTFFPAAVNQEVLGNQSDVAIAADPSGTGYFVAWDDPANSEISGRIINGSLQAATAEFTINSTVANSQFDPSVARLAGGNYVVTFTDTSTDTGEVRARLFSANGSPLGPDFVVGTSTLADVDSDVAALADGGFVVTWTRDYGAGDLDVRAQILNADGTPRGGSFPVDSTSALGSWASSVTGLAGGNFAVTWQETPAGGSDLRTYFAIYDASGGVVKTKTPVGAENVYPRDVQIVSLPDGGFAIAYSAIYHTTSDGLLDVFLAIYNADGTFRSGSIVNDATIGHQNNPTLAVLSNGFIMVGWNGGTNSYLQAFEPNGTRAGSNQHHSSSATEIEIAGLNSGRVAIAQESTESDGDGSSVRTSIMELRRATQGNNDAETLTGDDLFDDLQGLGGADTLNGGGGDDWLTGGEGADTLNGGAGSRDMALYYNSPAGVTVRLWNGTGTGGDAQGDTLIGIEDIQGSDHADTLIGSNGVANRLIGGNGNDYLEGLGGADELIGGSGLGDTAGYANSSSGVTVKLWNGTGSGGDAQGDTLSGIENVTGSAHNDTLIGANGVANRLDGGNGNDFLDGLGGADILIGGAGTDTAGYTGSAAGVTVKLWNGTGVGGDAQGDTLSGIENLTGSAHNDTLIGSEGIANRLEGGSGNDYLNGLSGNDVLVGGLGRDMLVGGAGNDQFRFVSAAESAVGANRDVIEDFEDAGDDDTIDLSGFAGTLSFIGGAEFTAANQVRAITSGANVLIQINTTGTSGVESEILLLNTTIGQITGTDFLLT